MDYGPVNKHHKAEYDGPFRSVLINNGAGAAEA